MELTKSRGQNEAGVGCHFQGKSGNRSNQGKEDSGGNRRSLTDASEPGLGVGGDPCLDATGISVFSSDIRLVQPVGGELGVIQHFGCRILPGSIRTGLVRKQTGDIQFGPGGAVHQPGFHQPAGIGWDTDQHGQPGSRIRQHLCGTAGADGEIRRSLPGRLPECPKGQVRIRPIFLVL